jgi:hypothetical protein
LAHVPPHEVSPDGQAHMPAAQLAPPAHVIPHAPQFELSLVVSTQAPVHDVRPSEQAAMQRPNEHDSLAAHA